MRRSRLQAEAMVMWSKGLKLVSVSNNRLNVKHPSFKRRTSDWQYLTSSFLKSKTLVALLLMPGFQGLLAFGGHGFRHVVIEGRDGSYVVLMVGMIKLVGEVPFTEFCQSKGFGKRGQRHLEETQ